MSVAEYVRPSSLSALEICAGRARMEARALATVPEIAQIRRPAADQGTMGHAVVAQTLALTYHQPGGWTMPQDALGQMAAHMESLEPWTRDAVRRCVAYAVALVDQAMQDGYEVTVQIEMHLSGQGIGVARGGTADLTLLCRDPVTNKIRWVIVSDWKLGWLDQGEAADHLQLAGYAVMAWDKYRPDLGVTVHLAQGRRQEFSSAHYYAADIEASRKRILAVAAAALADEPEIAPHMEACRYCKALTHCKPLRDRIMHAIETNALFGTEQKDRVRLASDAALARRFAEDAKELAKVWAAKEAKASA